MSDTDVHVPVPVQTEVSAAPIPVTPPPPPPVVGGMYSYAGWDALLLAMTRLEAAQDGWVDYPDSPLEPASKTSTTTTSAGTTTGPSPMETYVAPLGMNSLLSKYAAMEAGTAAPPTGVDTFAINFFKNSTIRSVLNSNFEVRVNGQVYNALLSALDVNDASQIATALQQSSPLTCTKYSTNRTRIPYTHAGVQRRFNTWSSFYMFGPVTMVTVNYDNEIFTSGKWRNERANLQIGVQGRVRATIACLNFANNTFADLTPLKSRRSIELRRVKIPDIWKSRNEFTNTLTVAGVPYARTVTYTWSISVRIK